MSMLPRKHVRTQVLGRIRPLATPAPFRVVRWVERPRAQFDGVIRVCIGGVSATYRLAEAECAIDDCRTFRLAKCDRGAPAAEDERVILLGRNGQDSSCSCEAFSCFSECQHVAALLALFNHG